MTAMLTDAIAFLCAAIDAGVDERAAGLRDHFIGGFLRPGRVELNSGRVTWGWQIGYGHTHSLAGQPVSELARQPLLRWGDWFLAESRSAAYLALAAALVEMQS